MLRRTKLIHYAGFAAIDEVEYYEMPRRTARGRAVPIKKLVMPHVHLIEEGMREGQMDTDVPHFFGVTSRPHSFGSPHAKKRAQEALVLAESIALENGVFTPGARANAVVAASDRIPKPSLEGFQGDSVAQLQALRDEVKSPLAELTKPQQYFIINELDEATNGLAVAVTKRHSQPGDWDFS